MSETLEALLQEGRTFPPPGEFRKDALDTDAYGRAGANADARAAADAVLTSLSP